MLVLVALTVGIVLVYPGAEFAAAYLTLGGIPDLALGLATLVLPGLSRHTLDPLGLHW